MKSFKFQVSSFKFQVSSFKFQVSSFKFQVSSFKFQVSSFEFQVANALNFKFLVLLALFSSGWVFGQSVPNGIDLSPNGLLDNVYDHYGNQLQLSDIVIDKGNSSTLAKSALFVSCSTTSYFNLYFESGSGMDSSTNADHIARRAIICKVFEDISNFIQSPLTANGNKVNIWVRNINTVMVAPNTPNNVLGVASSYYVTPSISSPTLGGIIDSEIWKTINSGLNSYTNVTTPAIGSNANTANNSAFYHGYVAFNFNTNNTSPFTWNLNRTINTPVGLTDLYSVALHEITHGLGFASLINEMGTSKFGANKNYFSRYDLFLKNNANTAFLLTTTSVSNMYDYRFNTSAATPLTILRPGCAAPFVNNGSLNTTICNQALRYVSNTNNVQVYTPKCYELGSSFSHFEDECTINPATGLFYGNDNYFVMSNANGSGPTFTKRYLKKEERNVLCDLGYTVNPTFGDATTFSGKSPASYYGTAVCGNINQTVVGVNDGILPNGNYAFVANNNQAFSILGSQLLINDVNADRFEYLHDMTTNTAIFATSGTGASTINFLSAVGGMHLLRYVPYNQATQMRGNITYVYVFVYLPTTTATCNIVPNSCNLVQNGDFEFNNGNIPNGAAQIDRACGWYNIGGWSTDYYHGDTPAVSYDVPCNIRTFLNDRIVGNKAYAGIIVQENPVSTPNIYNSTSASEMLGTVLTTPLQSNTEYTISFDVSLGHNSSGKAFQFQFLLTNNPALFNTASINISQFAIDNPSFNTIFRSTQAAVTRRIGWQTASFTFSSGLGGQKYLIFGSFNNAGNISVIPSPAPYPSSCGVTSNIPTNSYSADYFIDNVSLIATPNTTINFPTINCAQPVLNNLLDYVQNGPLTGTFAGAAGINQIGNRWEFDTTIAGIGTHTINYTYQNNLNCPLTLTATITVVANPPTPIITGNQNLCIGINRFYTTNIVGGTWSTTNPVIGYISPNTGELTPLQPGIINVIYTTPSGACPATTTNFQVTVFDPAIPPVFSFPTTFCYGATPPILPSFSDNGIPGDWSPQFVDNLSSAQYKFKPNNGCSDGLIQNITVINGGSLEPIDDTINLPFSSNSQFGPSLLLNDYFNGDLMLTNWLGLTIYLDNNPAGFTVDQNGKVRTPPGLASGTYTFTYSLSNDCLQSGWQTVTVNIVAPVVIDAPLRYNYQHCYNGAAFQIPLLKYITIDGQTGSSANLQINNFVCENGPFTLNNEGALQVPSTTMPGTYNFNFDVCQLGSTTNCVHVVNFSLEIWSTVRADGDSLNYYNKDGGYFVKSPLTFTLFNLLANDYYSSYCGPSGSALPPVIGTNVTFSSSFIGNTGLYFTINNTTGVLSNTSSGQPPTNNYSFTYTICDLNYPTICSTSGGFIRVFSNRMANQNPEVSIIDYKDITVAPNPSNGIFHLNFNSTLTVPTSVEVFNLLSQKLLEETIINTDNYTLSLDYLPTGTYLLKISDGSNNTTQKLIKN